MEQGGTRRGAIVEAMIRVAGGKGYLATSVADVATVAGASRTTFYKHFGDKQECFLAAYDLAVEGILAATETTCEDGRRWRDRARSGLAAVVDLLAADPAMARVAIVEVSAAGVEARRRHWATTDRFARLLEPDRPPQRRELPPNTALMAVSAVAGLIFDELREGGEANLPRILPELEFALLVPYLGPRTAAEAFATAVPLLSRRGAGGRQAGAPDRAATRSRR
ncbi:MAG TPA: TetR/AcrR family transcriptional regulator [Solirubrobacterales bacterium]|nr:TetR/AcrR family transcriptional regulator [Solirubrobacterales bacterium]